MDGITRSSAFVCVNMGYGGTCDRLAVSSKSNVSSPTVAK